MEEQGGEGDASEGSGEGMAALKGAGSRGVAVERTRGNGGATSGGGRPRGRGALLGRGIAAKASCKRRPVRATARDGGKEVGKQTVFVPAFVVAQLTWVGLDWAVFRLGSLADRPFFFRARPTDN